MVVRNCNSESTSVQLMLHAVLIEATLQTGTSKTFCSNRKKRVDSRSREKMPEGGNVTSVST